MSNATTFVGLDVHARSVKACAFVPETGETIRKSFGYEPGEIASWVSSLPQPARCVYESGVTGFHLCRELNAMGAACVIGAVSKMHKPAADRGRKTDRRDAQFLAVQLALGVVTEVHVPDAECEGARDLARALADARDDAVRAKQRLSKFLLRHGLVYDERNAAGQRRNRWTGDFWAWVGRIDLGDAAAMATLDHYCERVREADAAKAALEAKVKSLAQQPRWKPTCDALKCLKGIDAVTAASIACEADGFARFATASGFAAWVGVFGNGFLDILAARFRQSGKRTADVSDFCLPEHQGLVHPLARAVELDESSMVDHPVDHRGGKLVVAQDRSPFAELDVGGEHHASLLVAC